MYSPTERAVCECVKHADRQIHLGCSPVLTAKAKANDDVCLSRMLKVIGSRHINSDSYVQIGGSLVPCCAV